MDTQRHKGKLFIISGPSGAGKGTICDELIKHEDIILSVSMTTRPPREGEIDGIHYYFVCEEEFLTKKIDGGFLETAETFGNYYGTPKKQVLERLNEGKNVLLEIDTKGALQIKEIYPESILIFILPPSLKELKERISRRGTETQAQILKRLAEVSIELNRLKEYDYYVINDDLNEAVKSTLAIISAENSKISEDAALIIKRYEEEM